MGREEEGDQEAEGGTVMWEFRVEDSHSQDERESGSCYFILSQKKMHVGLHTISGGSEALTWGQRGDPERKRGQY